MFPYFFPLLNTSVEASLHRKAVGMCSKKWPPQDAVTDLLHDQAFPKNRSYDRPTSALLLAMRWCLTLD